MAHGEHMDAPATIDDHSSGSAAANGHDTSNGSSSTTAPVPAARKGTASSGPRSPIHSVNGSGPASAATAAVRAAGRKEQARGCCLNASTESIRIISVAGWAGHALAPLPSAVAQAREHFSPGLEGARVSVDFARRDGGRWLGFITGDTPAKLLRWG